MKIKIYNLILIFLIMSCSNSKNNNLNLIALGLVDQNSNESSNKENSNNIEVDFSAINQNIHSVLAYREKENKSNSWFVFSLSEKVKKEGWKEIPSSKKVEIEKGEKLELSLGGVVPLGEKKIDKKTNLTLVSVMGSKEKEKNFLYLALSLSSTKNGKLKIETSDLEKLKNKEVNFEQTYDNFKKDTVVTEALDGKTPAQEEQINVYSTNDETENTNSFILSGSSFLFNADKKLFAFGSNSQGQLGLGDTTDRTSPTEITDPNIKGKVKQVFSGLFHSFILTTDNKLFAFGYNNYGQLGLGDITNRTSPTEITDPNIQGKVKKIYSGEYHNLLLTTTGDIFAFGYNNDGQLGLGDTTDRTSPTEITDTNIKGKVKEIYVARFHSFILTTDNELFAFGSNDSGELVLGDETDRTSPTEITDVNIKGKVKQVFVHFSSHSFILTTNNKLFAFGHNFDGKLGLGLESNDDNGYDNISIATPTEITDSKIQGKVKQAFAGMHSSFILTKDNRLFSFGSNDHGQLGLGNTKSKASPTEITDSNIKGKVKQVFMGGSYSFIQTNEDKFFVFGRNDSGSLGLGDRRNRLSPVLFNLP